MRKEFRFKPFDKVLMRSGKGDTWRPEFFRCKIGGLEPQYVCIGGYIESECLPYNEEFAYLLGTTDDYVEPYEPKDGDFVVSEDESGNPMSIFIFKRLDGKDVVLYSIFYYSSSKLEIEQEGSRFGLKGANLRKATLVEISDFLSKLHEIGKDWNEEKKEIVEYKWKPSLGDEYWFVSSAMSPLRARWVADVDVDDERRYRIGNCFRTEAEALVMAKRIKKVLKGE